MNSPKLLALSKFSPVLLASALALAVPTVAHAYTFSIYCAGEPGILDTPTLPEVVNGCSIPTGSLQRDAVEKSVLFWNWYSNKSVSISGTTPASDCNYEIGDWQNDLVVVPRSSIDGNSGLTTKSHVNVCVDDPGTGFGDYSEVDARVASDMPFNTLPMSAGYPWCTGCTGGGRAAFVHEMGHQFGLDHWFHYTSMNVSSGTSLYPTSIWGPQPMPDDIAGLRSVYGAKAVVDLAVSGQTEVPNSLYSGRVISNHEFPELVCQGDSFSINLTTLNLGNTSQTYNQRAVISTSSDGSNPAAYWTVNGTVVPAGQHKQQTWNAVMPSSVPVGTYNLFHLVDHTASITEFVEVNNKLPYTGKIVVVDCPATMYTTGDFDNNGKTDVIITTPTGSYWYYSMGASNWTVGYIRTDLPIGTVKYTPADFNGDGKTDLIITTPSGSFWYYSTGLSGGVGTWNTAYSSASLPIGSAQFTTGDFDGNGKQDVFITSALGSELFYSTGTGTWSATVYKNADLPLGSVTLTPGDFDGDAKSDVIVTTAFGSFWFFSTGLGTWNTTAYQRTDLPRGSVAYTVGDFDGNAKKDVIITTASGSYWYYSTGRGLWNTTAYSRSDLPLNSVAYTMADFTNDGKSDLVITTASGSYWYYSTGLGTWNNTQHSRSDLKLNKVMFTPGDYSGDGKKDLIFTTSAGSTWYLYTTQSTWLTADQRTDLPL